jgi:hypothetical protein
MIGNKLEHSSLILDGLFHLLTYTGKCQYKSSICKLDQTILII